MNTKNIIFAIFINLITISCVDNVDIVNSNRGFVEIQYPDTVMVNGIQKVNLLYSRSALTKAIISEVDFSELPDSLKTKFIEVKLSIFSDSMNTDATTQSLGSSMVEFVLVIDTTIHQSDFKFKLANTYTNLDDMTAFADRPIVKPSSCVGLKNYIGKLTEDSYKLSTLLGDNSTKLYIYEFGNGIYQLTTTGLYKSKRYNVSYIGKITQK